MYNTFSQDYDRFVNWQGRLAYELPFLEKQIDQLKGQLGRPLDILDTACGTGMHAIALAKLGHQVSAADLFPEMVAKGEENARTAGVQIDYAAAGLGKMQATFGSAPFDLLLCLGNSLPHVLSELDLFSALQDFADVLRPGGMVFIQNRNFGAVMQHQERWMEPQSFQAEGKEWIFQRFYDFLPDGLIRFNIVTLTQEHASGWQSQVGSTLLRPQLSAELKMLLLQVGFQEIHTFGSMQGEDFAPETSGNLILTAIRP